LSEKVKDFTTLKYVLVEILEEVGALSGCQSVGIRLEKDGDYPYYVYNGFPGFFILKENSLCARDEEGRLVMDDDSNPLLECMCGNILKGRFDPEFPFFTEKGSFWTNSTTQLLATITREQRQVVGRTRDMCHHSGYESVALIPMRVEGRTLGLIQLNDPRENMFTPEKIETFELIADHVGAVVLNAYEITERMAHILDIIARFRKREE
jgi:hypothetical protein